MVFRYSFGVIMSVSMFAMSSGAATPLRLLNLGIPAPPPELSVSRMIGPADSTAASFCACCTVETSSLPGMWASCMPRTSVSWPVTAAAAAMEGEQRCVRPPTPCRPSKLRLDVEAHLSLSPSLSGFMARHIEQPGSRHSKPASSRMMSRPSSSACSFTRPEPGTTIAALIDSCTFRPLATAATARISSMRAFVHEPMKTLSMLMASTGLPTCSTSPMYLSARSYPAFFAGSACPAGSGT
mmetsp:Transcript_3665/g.7812  ORF Transcript_3665/g.7812 Transcript_3665/m.7812 type:complete len:240 (+) Transcript_3665:1090-1809(+)